MTATDAASLDSGLVPPDDPPGEPAREPGSLPEGERRRVVGALAVLLPVFAVLAVLVFGSAVALRLLLDPVGDRIARGAPSTQPVDRGGAVSASPTSVALSTPPTISVGDPPPAVVSPPAEGAPSLIAIPVAEGATAIAPTTAPAVTAPPVASARVRVFNAYADALDVWDVASGAPVRYGTVQYGAFAELAIDGRWLPSGVDLELRFVPAGGDPTAESASRWSFTPPAGSSQTLVLSDNGGLRVLRVDNDRATRATPEGQAHIVPAVFHLIVGGHRSHQWATPGGGCLGHLTTDKAEFDVAVGTVLVLADGGDPTCGVAVSGALGIAAPGAFVVVGLDQGAGVQLVALPL